MTGFREKPKYHFDVSMGVYAFSRSLLSRIPADRPYGIDTLVLDMLQAGVPVKAYPFHGYWLDIGRPEDYDRANQDAGDLLKNLVRPREEPA